MIPDKVSLSDIPDTQAALDSDDWLQTVYFLMSIRLLNKYVLYSLF